jgi:hypothetical protein
VLQSNAKRRSTCVGRCVGEALRAPRVVDAGLQSAIATFTAQCPLHVDCVETRKLTGRENFDFARRASSAQTIVTMKRMGGPHAGRSPARPNPCRNVYGRLNCDRRENRVFPHNPIDTGQLASRSLRRHRRHDHPRHLRIQPANSVGADEKIRRIKNMPPHKIQYRAVDLRSLRLH